MSDFGKYGLMESSFNWPLTTFPEWFPWNPLLQKGTLRLKKFMECFYRENPKCDTGGRIVSYPDLHPISLYLAEGGGGLDVEGGVEEKE